MAVQHHEGITANGFDRLIWDFLTILWDVTSCSLV
jgi:hypothetical protein